MSDCEQIDQVTHEKWATMSEIAQVAHGKRATKLQTKGQPWANRSGRSWQQSDCERFAHVAHEKRANEQITCFFERIAHSLFRSQKQVIPQKNLDKIIFYFFKVFFKLKKIEGFAHSLLFKERYERIAQFAPNERATVSESLRLLSKNEQPWVIRSGGSPKMSDCERIAQVAHQKWANERIAHSLIFSQKKSYSLRKPMSKFPTQDLFHKTCLSQQSNSMCIQCVCVRVCV